ncbi:DUF58 domain-containing protein [Methyloligella solikamskensis]|uniref:DUF58 domain-containing protein n=1 Tax=Methyloligella solikamskensis TaxID=1177756 RepID=A0ABW3JCJ3_9HYPH
MKEALPQEPTARQSVDLPYRLAWRSSAVRIGAHRGTIEGAGGLLRDYVSLLRSPDPRRIDLRHSMRDPFGNLYVKRFEQKSAITLYALVDLSGSMGFVGDSRKMQAVADICGALAASSRRIGDSFGLIGCDGHIVPDLFMPATRSRAGESEMIRGLRSYQPSGKHVDGLFEAANYLSGKRKLVFLISDFYLPTGMIERLFEALAGHDVVPIVLRDAKETEDFPAWGLVTLQDLESGRRRLLAMRPSLREKLIAEAAQQRETIGRIARRYGRPPCELQTPVDWEHFTDYLMGEAA